MKNKMKGLFAKIYGLVLVPSIAFLILSALFLKENFNNYSLNKEIQQNIPTIRTSFNLLSALQIERGMSIGFISGTDNFEKLTEHRRKVDGLIEVYLKTSKKIFSKEVYKKSLNNINQAIIMRNKIDSRETIKQDIAKNYTAVVMYLIHKINEKIIMVDDPELIRALININTFSEAQESGGLLRANFSAILNRKNGINDGEMSKILSLKSKFYAFSRSSSIHFQNVKSKELHEVFLKSSDHNLIKSVILDVITDNKSGKYSITGSQFFSTMTELLNKLKIVTLSEITTLEELSLEHQNSAWNKFISMLIVIIIYLTLATIFTTVLVVKLVKAFRKNLHALNNKTMAISLATTSLNSNSKQVFEASNNQAQGIEETSAAIHQINKIQLSTNQLVKDGKIITEDTTLTAQKGKTQVQNMLNSINKISSSNGELRLQVKENNENFNKVTNVINEIASKTGIINDIVFQTKLLSFNASVEAARAGEHGKGFSVVAEEIGQLANLSGNAANEIAALVSSSIDLVSSMTKEMATRMDHFVESSNDHIKKGSKEAQDCNVLFEEMLSSITTLKESVTQIESSAVEQGEAINNISSNVNQLDSATKSNLSSISDNFKNSESIFKSSKELKDVVDDMCVIIRGEKISEEDQENFNRVIELNSHKKQGHKKVA